MAPYLLATAISPAAPTTRPTAVPWHACANAAGAASFYISGNLSASVPLLLQPGGAFAPTVREASYGSRVETAHSTCVEDM